MIFGLVGGIGCGKSLVGGLFVEFGAGLIDADVIGHELLSDSAISEQIRSYFGECVFCNINGVNCVDRFELARIVFAQTEAGFAGRKYLNSILHPPITKIINEKIQYLTQKNFNIIILDAPLLLETGFDKIADKIIFIDASRENRLARVLKRNWTENDLKLRESAQLPIEKKRQLADFIIPNNNTIADTKKEVELLLQKFKPKNSETNSHNSNNNAETEFVF
ncbi:MAG: dephospho-CoA kinase [Planctomycetaceae bacterium]|jgi:dephospho-CoA kinase|nr:dephospho-CoA kinase [Planctomycetaceae bacterium]